jgi:hypothetical protein
MIDVVLVFVVGSVLALVAGGGWATLLASVSNSWIGWAFWTFTIGIAVESLAWSWALGLGGGFWAAMAVYGMASVLGWIVAVRTGGWLNIRRGMPIGLQHVDVAALVVAAAVMIAPGLDGFGSTTLAYRIGSDAFGNAVGAEALASGEDVSALERDIVAQTGAPTLDSALDQKSHMLYTAASFRTQVRTEYIVAGLRWGYSGAAAIPLRIVGLAWVWAVVTLLPVLAALFAVLGIICLLAAAGVGPWKRAAAIALSVLGVTLLNGFREGGLAQMWVVPCIVAFAWAVVDEALDRRTRMWMGAIAAAGLLPAYSDAAFALAAVLALLIIIALLVRDRPRALEYCWFAVGAAAGVVTTGPFLVRFIAYLPKRLNDSQVGGWLLPRWTSPSETIGLFNSYNQRAVVGTVPRSDLLQVAVALSDVMLVGLTMVAVTLVVRRRAASLLIATTVIVAVFYAKSRYVDHATNYQYFKAAGIGQPLLGLSLVLVWHRAAILSRRVVRRLLVGLTAYAGAACAVTTVVYTAIFINQDSTVDQHIVDASVQPAIRDLVDSRNIVAPLELRSMALVPLLDAHWFGRSMYNIPERVLGRESNPLSLLVFRQDCKDWKCIDGVGPDVIHDIGPTLRMVDLAQNSRAIAGPGGTRLMLPAVISALSQSIGGPVIGADCRPVT